jgi:threonylcarbamoyladenosine tRNA methylthiotransferase MtaB
VTRVYLHTFGCKANQYDTELLRQALESVGASVVDSPADADAAVVNSCTVTHASETKMRRLVRRMARARPDAHTVVMGCAAALDDGTIAALPGVTSVVGGADPARVLRALGLQPNGTDPLLRRFARGARAWLKIQDGCDEHCTFCATTLARGRNRSRTPAEVVQEARALGRAHREIVLTGVHIGTYGRDVGDGSTLSSLVERLVHAVPEVRFRLSSVEATEIDERLAELMIAEPEHVAPHIHAPLQSGSDRVLRRMGRHWYTAAKYRRRLEWLAERLPCLGLGADVMVGFPGETKGDFGETVRMVEVLPFTYLHVFPYSERSGAPARRLGPAVAPATARCRSEKLRRLAAQKAASYRKARHGGTSDIVVLRRSRGHYEALTEDYLSVYLSTDQVPPTRTRATLRVGSNAVWADPIAG